MRASGIAYGLTGLMRALPVHASRGRVDLPAETLLRHGTSPEQVLAGQASKGLAEVLAEFRETARVALKSARAHVAALPREARKAFLPLALVEPYLSALRKVDPLRQVAEINPLYRLWRLSTCRFPPRRNRRTIHDRGNTTLVLAELASGHERSRFALPPRRAACRLPNDLQALVRQSH